MAEETRNLDRFMEAQAGVYPGVQAELSAGRKRSHWMWFIFPQLKSLGHSDMALHYGLADADEAQAYWQHPVLGPRLRHCARQLLAARQDASARDILGTPDDLKLRSCMTLFARVAPEEPVFAAVLARFYGGLPDPATLALLG